MSATNRPEYPLRDLYRAKRLIRCSQCGAERLSAKKEGASYAPKRCQACNIKAQAILLAKLFRGNYPRRPA